MLMQEGNVRLAMALVFRQQRYGGERYCHLSGTLKEYLSTFYVCQEASEMAAKV